MYDITRSFSKFPTFFDVSTVKDLFDSLSGDFCDFPTKCFPYPINLYSNYDENNHKIVTETILEVALAGFSKDEIEVKIDDNTLTISVEKETKDSADTRKYHSRGIAKRNASISYPVSSSADIENTKVTFKDGILKVVVPTKKEVIEEKKVRLLTIE